MPPNVIVLVLDAARRDAFEPYGAPAGSSPTLAQLASRGAALPDVFATGCWTVPSHASIFTGLLPRAASLAKAPGGHPHGCRPVLEGHRERLLPEVLRRAGYATGAVSTNLWVSENSGFDIGFDEFTSIDSGRQARIHGGGLLTRLRWELEALRAGVDDGAARAERTLRSWLERGERRPFFWFVNLVECHSPYLPPRPYDGIGPRERVRAARDARRHLTLDAIWRECAGGFDISDVSLERMRKLYRGAIRYLDDWIARLVDSLDSNGVLDDTLLIVTADHGENIGEGGLIAHALSLDNRLINVPFVMLGPNRASERRLRSLAQLPLLVVESAGIEAHPYRSEDLPDGAAVAQFDPAVGPADPRAREAVERWGLGDEALARLTTPLTCATDGKLKLLRRGQEEELYDLDEDPHEARPRLLGDSDTGDRRLEALRAAVDHRATVSPGAGTPGPAREVSSEELEGIEERMRLLGYI